MSIYRKILSQAWQATWRNKYLWFFGLFAMLLGNGGELEIIFRNFNLDLNQGILAGLKNFAQTGIFKMDTIYNIGGLLKQDPLSVFIALSVLFLLALIGLFIIWLTIMSQAAIVNNYGKIANGKNTDFQEGVAVGMNKFWPVLTFNAIAKFLVYLIFVLLSLPIIMNAAGSVLANGILFLLLFIAFIPLAMAISFISKYAIAYVVIKGENFFSALQSGWKLFRENWLVSIEMAIILFAFNFAVGMALLLTVMILAIPFLFIGLVFAYSAMILNFWVIATLALLFFILLVAGTGAALAVFQTSAWTGLYLELVGKGAVSKIVRVFGGGK